MELTEQFMDVQKKTETTRRLLFVGERNETTATLLELLVGQDYQIKEVSTVAVAFDILHGFMPNVIILDSCGNEPSTLEFCVTIKSTSRLNNSVVIILSDRKDELMEMTALNSGADDFATYPIRINALLVRIKARMKKQDKTITITQHIEDTAPLKIDRESYTVTLGNHLIQLTKKEFELLYLMAGNPEKLFRREELIRSVWNNKLSENDRTLDVHISRLRQKLGNRFISSQKGIGYRFKLS